MSYYSLPSLLAALIVLRHLCHLKGKDFKSMEIKLFALLLIQFMIYLVGECCMINSGAKMAQIWIRVLYFATPLMPAVFLHLVSIYARSPEDQNNAQLLMIYLPAVFFILLLPTRHLIAGVQPYYWGYGKVEGWAYQLMRWYFVLYFCGILFVIFRRMRKTDSPRIRNALGYLAIASVCPMVVVSTVAVYLQQIGIHYFNIIAFPLTFVFFSTLLNYAITTQHLFDLHLIIAPVVKTQKYYFHRDLTRLVQSFPYTDSIDSIMKHLSNVFQCDISINLTNKTYVSTGRSNDPYHYLLSSLYSQGKYIGFIKCSRVLTEYLYSKQDRDLINRLCEGISVAVYCSSTMDRMLEKKDNVIRALSHRIDEMRKPITISVGPDNKVHTVYTPKSVKAFVVEHESKKIIDCIDTEEYPRNQLKLLKS